MIKQKIFTLLLFLLFLEGGFSQLTVDNDRAHRRYWYYRTRMINDFIKIGKEQGACIVFPERNYLEKGFYTSKVGPDQIDITNMYIMTLCLEYKLLSRNNQDTRETIRELYHLLYTINRLDLEAEPMMNPVNWLGSDVIQPSGTLNGYMLREDMPKRFMTDNFLHYNYALQERPLANTDPLTNYGGFTGIPHTNELSPDNKFSDFFPFNHGGIGQEPFTDLTLVQDKYMSMLAAMMFVNKYIPFTTTYNGESFQDGETSLKQEASNIANRCYSYLRNKNNDWVLRYLDQDGNYAGSLAVGSTAFLYSWGLSRMVCWANTNFPWNQNSPVQCTDYNNDYVSTIPGRVIYNAFTLGTASCGEDNAVFKGWCQAGSNSPSFNNFGLLLPAYITMGPNAAYNGVEWLELLRKVLHQDGVLGRQLSVYGDAIETAPCQGPYNYGNCVNGGFEWSSQDRLEHPGARNSDCNPNAPAHPVPCLTYVGTGGFMGNYPGVDYMLLHNLYYEYQNQLLDGNAGNDANSAGSNVVTTIFNAGNAVGSTVSSALCSIQNALGSVLQNNSNICDPTLQASGNGGPGSNISVPGYKAYNYMDNHDANIWPRTLSPELPIQGTTSFIGKVGMFQNLSSEAHIYASTSPAAPQNTIPSQVTYRAGKEIDLQAGFQVDAGSTFHAFVQRYICTGNDDAMQLRQGNDSLKQAALMALNYELDRINPVPIHHIESEKSDSDLSPIVPEYPSPTNAWDGWDRQFEVLPNPNNGVFRLQVQKLSDNEVLSINVYDLKGEQVYALGRIDDEQELDLSVLSAGLYILQLHSDSGWSMTKKLSIIR